MSVTFNPTFDCADPAKLAGFWAKLLGYELQGPPPGFATWEDWLRANNVPEDKWNSGSIIADPHNKESRIFFQQVPESKLSKNRLHLDVHLDIARDKPSEEIRQEVARKAEELKEIGATKVVEGNEFGSFWIVMQDPEGNEFCIA